MQSRIAWTYFALLGIATLGLWPTAVVGEESATEIIDRAVAEALSALEQGDFDASRESLTRTFADGPPQADQARKAIATLFGPPAEQETSQPAAASPRIVSASAVAILTVVDAWEQHAVSDREIFEALQFVVLPESSMSVNTYSRSQGTTLEPNVGSELIRWAVRAEQSERLRSELIRRLGDHDSLVIRSMLVELGVVSENEKQVRQELLTVRNGLPARLAEEDLAALELIVTLVLDNPSFEYESLELVEAVAESLAAIEQKADSWSITADWLTLAARLRNRVFETDRAVEHLDRVRTIYAGQVEEVSGENWIWADRYLQLATEYLLLKELERGLDLLAASLRFGSPEAGRDWSKTANVAALLHRQLEDLDAATRYERIYEWTFATADDGDIRAFASWTVRTAPPETFARAVGKRPGADVFPIPHVGEISGLFGTLWELVQAAEQSGHTNQLRAAVQSRMALAGTSRSELDALSVLLSLSNKDAANESTTADVLIDRIIPPGEELLQLRTHADLSRVAVVAAASLEDQRNSSLATPLLQRMIATQQSRYGDNHLTVLRRMSAEVQAVANGNNSLEQLFLDGRDASESALWIPAGLADRQDILRGENDSLWISHEQHLMHFAGPRIDSLLFRYPLAGTFTFQLQTQTGADAEGHLSWNGQGYHVESQGFAVVSNADFTQTQRHRFPFVRQAETPTYARMQLEVSGRQSRLDVNGHPLSMDANLPSTPWLALRSSGDQLPAFKEIQFTMAPEILSQVDLTQGDSLRGWSAKFFDETLVNSDRAGANAVKGARSRTPRGDWQFRHGEIVGTFQRHRFQAENQSRLTYFRPLQAGESISYEFYYEEGRTRVHPALGQLAFLIQPQGVELHWMTSSDSEWTGLTAQNSTFEPVNRRGPRTLPLHNAAWNQVTMQIADGRVQLSLNSELIYERSWDSTQNSHFSFYRNKARDAARIRNVVLHGDWAEKVSAQQLAHNPILPASVAPLQVKAVRDLLVAERHAVDSVLDVHNRALRLSPEERYEFLRDWVMPNEYRRRIRIQCDFSPTHPAPIVETLDPLDRELIDWATKNGRTRVQLGGRLISPLADLIDVAAELNKLDELRELATLADESRPDSSRTKSCALGLIEAAAGNAEAAEGHLFRMFELHMANADHSVSNSWPETLVADRGLRMPIIRKLGRELAFDLMSRQDRGQTHGGSGSDRYGRFIAALGGYASIADESEDWIGGTTPAFANDFTQWDHGTTLSNRTRGEGRPPSVWLRQGSRATILAAHDREMLYFQSPLQGHFAIESVAPSWGWRETGMLVGGKWMMPRYNRTNVAVGDLHDRIVDRGVTGKLMKFLHTHQRRIQVNESTVSWTLNGLQTNQESNTGDPWLAIFNRVHPISYLEDIRITGAPIIPDEISLSAHPELPGWLPYFEDESLAVNGGDWHPQTSSRRSDAPAGGITFQPLVISEVMISAEAKLQSPPTFHESLLRYHRPMLENGSIRYQFFYKAGEMEVHPALDRLVLLLQPDGVQEHWLTDGAYERTGLSAANASIHPENQRGPKPLPFVENNWNELEFQLNDSVIQLQLNGEPIYERSISPANQRYFGLFRYADRTSVLVRRVTWRGDWPKALPTPQEQELGGEYADFLDRDLDRLTDVFDHDFAAQGLPPGRFRIPAGNYLAEMPNGLKMGRQGTQGYYDVILQPRNLGLSGDFDVTLEFDDYNGSVFAEDSGGNLALSVIMEGETRSDCRIMRKSCNLDEGDQDEAWQTAIVHFTPEGRKQKYSQLNPYQVSSGKLRLARRGKMVHFLVSEGDSPNFRLVQSTEVDDRDIEPNGVRIAIQNHNQCRIESVIKRVTIRAESIKGLLEKPAAEFVADLNTSRQQLAANWESDFSAGLPAEQFHRWSIDNPLQTSTAGLHIEASGTTMWTSAGAAVKQTLLGDFDAVFEFDIERIASASPGKASEVLLQAHFGGPTPIQISSVFMKYDDGLTSVKGVVRHLTQQSDSQFTELGRNSVEDVCRLRIARRGARLFLLYATAPENEDALIGIYDVGTAPVPPNGLRMLVHNATRGLNTQVTWKKLSVRADAIQDAAVLTPPPRVVPANENFLQRTLRSLFE